MSKVDFVETEDKEIQDLNSLVQAADASLSKLRTELELLKHVIALDVLQTTPAQPRDSQSLSA